jgi:predicted dehydrogenase
LEYPRAEESALAAPRSESAGLECGTRHRALPQAAVAAAAAPCVSVIGSGNYATAVLIPAFKAAGARLKRQMASNGGVSSVHLGRKFGFEEATTDTAAVLADAGAAAGDQHPARQPCRICAARAGRGKHVFVEKPLALTAGRPGRIEAAARRPPAGW